MARDAGSGATVAPAHLVSPRSGGIQNRFSRSLGPGRRVEHRGEVSGKLLWCGGQAMLGVQHQVPAALQPQAQVELHSNKTQPCTKAQHARTCARSTHRRSMYGQKAWVKKGSVSGRSSLGGICLK